MGNPEASDTDIEEALKKANAYEFLKQFEDGINLNVGI